jgi:pilus assembly protein Flp/PilA
VKVWPLSESTFKRETLQRGSNMRKLGQHLVKFLKNEDGPTAVEYAVMLALIIVVCIAAITALGTNANNTFSYVGTEIGGTAGS